MSGEVPSDPEELLSYLSERRTSDGLPVIPPTEERVERMLGSPEDARVVVAGGPGNWTSIVYSHTFSGNPAVTKPIEAA